jgi:hypothetical protein
MSADPRYALNAICPYFTMFPLEYPMRVLDPAKLDGYKKPIVADPFCGRGTTIFAAPPCARRADSTHNQAS